MCPETFVAFPDSPMMSASWMSLLMMLAMGGGGRELLDYVPTDAYWKSKDIVVSVALPKGAPSAAAYIGRNG